MTSRPRPSSPGDARDSGAGGAAPGTDAYVDRLGGRIESAAPAPPAPLPRPAPLKRGGPAPPLPPSKGRRPTDARTSDVRALSPVTQPPASREREPDVPYVEGPAPVGDPFAQFEELEGESTRIDTGLMVAEQTTNILEDAPSPPILWVESGKDLGKEFVVGFGETGVGRSIDNDIILTDIAVSRRHMKLMREGDVVRAIDLGSGNGTRVNGKKIHDVPLAHGDRIEIGETALVMRLPALPAMPLGAQAVVVGNPSEHAPTTDENPSPPSLLPPSPAPMMGPTPGVTPTGFMPGRADSTTGAQAPSVAVPRGLLIALLAIGAMLVALGGAAVTLLIVRRGPAPTVDSAPSVEEASLQRGLQAYTERRYPDAERELGPLATKQPADPRATRYLELAHEGSRELAVIQAGQAAVARGDAQSALVILRDVPATGPLGADAEALRVRARAALAAAAAAGPAPVVATPTPIAPTPVAPVSSPAVAPIQIAPAVAAVQTPAPIAQPRDRRPNTVRHPSPPVQHPPTPVQRPPTPVVRPVTAQAAEPTAGASQARVQQLYRAASFSEASRLARGAPSTLSGAERASLRNLADRIDRFAAAKARADGAGGNASIGDLESAYNLDQQIVQGGAFARDLRQRLVSAYTRSLMSLWPQGAYVPACRNIQRALQLDPRNDDARRRMRESCERKATEWIGTARGLERSDPTRARQMYLDIQRLVPSTSSQAQTATERLRALPAAPTNTRRPAVDEDEG